MSTIVIVILKYGGHKAAYVKCNNENNYTSIYTEENDYV
jgi:hypothetical protein